MTPHHHRDSLDSRLASGPEIDEQRAQEVKDAYAVAWRYALDTGVDQIGRELGMSRATVYRLIKEAQEAELLDVRPRVALPHGPGARVLMDQVLHTTLGEEVRECFDPRIAPREVLVVSNVGLPGPSQREEYGPERYRTTSPETCERVGAVAARRLMMAILEEKVRIIGINWGFHCWRVSESLPGSLNRRMPRADAEAIEFFPLVGSVGDSGREASLKKVLETSANSNAARCAGNLSRYGVEPERRDTGLPAVNPPVQLTQPCVIPQEVAADRDWLVKAWEYISLDKSVQAVFGEDWARARVGLLPRGEPVEASWQPGLEKTGPLLARADALLTGISGIEHSRAVTIGAIERSLHEKARAAGAVAELSAHYICSEGDCEDRAEALREVNQRVVAPTLEDYVRCTQEAKTTGRGMGTMLVSSGARKAPAAMAAISHGAVNVLVCDEDLAEELVVLARQARE